MILDEELERAMARVVVVEDWEQVYNNSNSWSNANEDPNAPRLPPVGTAFSFSRNFAGQQIENSNSCGQMYQYPEYTGQYQDEAALLCFPSLQQCQMNIEESLQAVDDFDLSLIRWAHVCRFLFLYTKIGISKLFFFNTTFNDMVSQG